MCSRSNSQNVQALFWNSVSGIIAILEFGKKIHHNSEDMLDLDLKKTNLRRPQRDSEVHLL